MADAGDIKVLSSDIVEKVRRTTNKYAVETRRDVLRAVARRLSAEADRLEGDWG